MSSHPAPETSRYETITETLKEAESCTQQWVAEMRLTEPQQETIWREWRAWRESLTEQAEAGAPITEVPGISASVADEGPTSRALRLWKFMLHEIHRLKVAGVLSQYQAHDLQSEAAERVLKLERQLADEGGGQQAPAPPPLPPLRSAAGVPIIEGGGVAKTRRNILEILLDPRSIQWLLGIGGALMVVGLVILLWINQFFTPPKMAVAMGLANVGILGFGWLLIQRTRYQLVGRAFTLLACLVMPLNLWYYQHQGLVTLDGHLWLGAVVICALYGASAVVLKDEMFAYVFCAGVAMTGLLILADWLPGAQKLLEIASPATLLVLMGLAAIHSERAFPAQEGPFSRERFGMAFFRSGHVMMAGGLLMILAAKLSGDWFYEPLFKGFYEAKGLAISPICNELQWLALSLVLLATYGYVYSDLVVQRVGTYIHIAAITLLWAEMLCVEMLHLKLGLDAVIAVLAVTSLVINILQASLTRDMKLTRSFPMFGLLLGLVPVVLGTVQHFRFMGLREVWSGAAPTWSFAGAMLLAAAASRVGAHVYRHSVKWLSNSYFFAAAAATMVAVVAALAAMGFKEWQQHAPIMMLVPLAYLVASRMYRGHTPEAPLGWVAHAATGVMLISSLGSALEGFTPISQRPGLNLSLALFFLEAAVFYALAAVYQRRAFCVHLTTLMASAALWQVMTYFGVSTDTYIMAFAAIGLLLLCAYRFSLWEKTGAVALAGAAFEGANTMLSLAFLSSVFRGLSRLASDEAVHGAIVNWVFVATSAAMLVIALLTVVTVRVSGWRRWYVVMTVAQGAVTLLALHEMINLSPWQQVELFSVIAGLLLLFGGHIGWYREQDRQSDMVSMSLTMGSILATLPLAIATWVDRAEGQFLILNETGFLLMSVLLLGSGVVFQLRATTLVGGAMTALYFATLLIFVPWGRLDKVAWLLLIGGGLVFGVGSVLAFFRDRLLTLPSRIRSREGWFRVLNWR